MYWRDHQPPHFHAAYAGHVAEIDIELLVVLDGWLPGRALQLVPECCGLHRQELLANYRGRRRIVLRQERAAIIGWFDRVAALAADWLLEQPGGC